MKLRNIAISAFAAAVAMVACNKQDVAPTPSKGLMTVEISLENLNFTKASTDAFLTDQTKVQLNNFKIYLTDGSGLYSAKSLTDVTPQYYYSVASGEALPKTVTLDLVPAEVNRVVVVGNVAADWGPDPDASGVFAEDLDDLKAQTLDIAGEQEYKDLTLYGEATLALSSATHTHSDNTTYGVYTAEVQLAPLVARFELDGFAMTYSSTNPKFDKIEVKQIALNKYYSSTTINPLAPATLVDAIGGEVNDKVALDYFAANLSVTGAAAWYYDANLGVSLARTDADANGVVKANLASGNKLSYHFFPDATTSPQLFIELAVTPVGEAIALPSYIYSKEFRESNGDAVTFEPGYVYRMNFQGTANNGDGDIPFDEDDIQQIEKCLEITVDVLPWTVVSVYPEF